MERKFGMYLRLLQRLSAWRFKPSLVEININFLSILNNRQPSLSWSGNYTSSSLQAAHKPYKSIRYPLVGIGPGFCTRHYDLFRSVRLWNRRKVQKYSGDSNIANSKCLLITHQSSHFIKRLQRRFSSCLYCWLIYFDGSFYGITRKTSRLSQINLTPTIAI